MPDDAPGKVFSPSRTEVWKKCPLKMHYQYEENLEYKYSRGITGKISGTGFSNGSAVIHTYWQTEGSHKLPPTDTLQAAKEAAAQSIIETVDTYRAAGVDVVADDILSVVQPALEKYGNGCPFTGYTINHVEYTMPEHGWCRIDVGAEKDGRPLVVDAKFKTQLKSDYYSKTIQRYMRSWQFYHYAWAYSEVLARPVNWAGLMLVVARPFSAKLIVDPLPPDWQQVWLTSARQTWEDMEDERNGIRPITVAADHEDQYGPCEYASVCFDYLLDVDSAKKGDYIQIPRRKHGSK